MLAFFDSLLQRELNGEEDDDDSDGLREMAFLLNKFDFDVKIVDCDDLAYAFNTSDDDSSSTENEDETRLEDLDIE